MRTVFHPVRVLTGVIAAVAVVGAAIAVLPAGDRGVAVQPPSAPPAATAAAAGGAEGDPVFHEYFTSGVEYLRQGRPHEALVSFNAATYLRPHIADTFINIGYAHVALGKPTEAAMAFEHALTLNPAKANAYYGLAMALEALQRLEEALGAMRTFEHLLPTDETKFRRLATAAIWEWEHELRERRARTADGKGDPHGHPPASPR
ncbi:MAG TPA: tetratricopeptide repeat protein [Azospirillum sp.]|nr:tetratricopeptide repeat protein [Azospirillum sp.]